MTKSEKDQNTQFVFRKHDYIGAAAAEDDVQFLEECFVDTGELALLTDCSNPKRIIVGRTGTGKSALISELCRRCGNVVQLSPHALSLNFIANNNVIAFFETAGVNLSAFYGLLWRHVLVVELLKKRFNIVNEEAHKNYMRTIRSILYRKDKIKEQAVDYLEKWGNKFWLTTEERVHELTEKIETNLSGAVGATLGGVELSAEGAKSLSTEQRKEVVDRGQKAVSEVQIRELENMISVLSDNVFDDRKAPYYITIDMLDEEWADDRIKFKLIKSLIDTIRRFRSIENVKIIAALRHDLLTKILHQDPTPGFQEEKYESLYLNIQWNKENLEQIIVRRINHLIKHRYTKASVSFTDVFPSNVDGKGAIDYLTERTFLRPRDIILFVNESIALCEGRATVTATIIKHAEEQYSIKRLQSLATEWLNVYPNLIHISRLFRGLSPHFPVNEITKEFLEDRYPDVARNVQDIKCDPITKSIDSLYTSSGNFLSVRSFMLREFYITGLVGIKTDPSSSIRWSYDRRPPISVSDIRPSSVVYIHPMFYRALAIRGYQKT